MIEGRIKELGFSLPEPPKPLAAYVPALQAGEFVFTAGQLPMSYGQLKYTGKLGKDVTPEDGKKAAEICALNCLSAVKGVIGELKMIEQVVKLTVFVNSAEGFTDQPAVANGASELIEKIFGKSGSHARSAVGVNELPKNAPVEIEMIVKVKK
ncbi:MAG TPA: RidA family protein [Ignavibacteriaceae bacterium]|nr:RidA family protein [Ignavibacteriaceae bacterium]